MNTIKKATAVALLLSAATCAQAKIFSNKVYYWQVLSVSDDALLIVDSQKDFLLPIKVKVQDVYYPTKKTARCAAETNLANRAVQLINSKIYEAKKNGYQITFENISWDPEQGNGTVLADVYLGGENLAELLFKYGVGKKTDPIIQTKSLTWCM